jgi:hypothetical protein
MALLLHRARKVRKASRRAVMLLHSVHADHTGDGVASLLGAASVVVSAAASVACTEVALLVVA